MSQDKSDKSNLDKQARKSKDRAAEIANTFEWLITAFILAFVFRAFVMEAFRIPTGSMADTLKGAHFRLRCRQCGYEYEHGFVPNNYFDRNGRRLPEDTVPSGNAPLAITRCPNCGRYPSELRCRICGPIADTTFIADRNRTRRNTNSNGNIEVPSSRCPRCSRYLTTTEAMPVANGDRILVLKCIYQFIEPKRWDVIVFKNPTEPTINYIKRLIGLPGDKIQIIDGDIYIDDIIARKSAKIQNELWMPVYDNDYQPVRPEDDSFNGHIWAQPFRNVEDSKWVITSSNSPTIFRLESSADQLHSIVYDTTIGNDFKATYAYDDIDTYSYMPICSDLMVRFDCRASDSQGRIGIALSKYETTYKAWIDFAGEMVITKSNQDGRTSDLVRSGPVPVTESAQVKFANVDHQLIFQYGDKKLTYDLGRDLQDAGPIREDIEPRVEIFGSGRLTLSHIAIFRDIHYTEAKFSSRGDGGRATKDSPFILEKDQFFVLGDNSPNSEDGRWWDRAGVANKGLPDYRMGTVPRDYLVGKALFVYWPSGFKPFAEFPFGIVPNIGRMRFIFGGSNGND
ncbi:MAG: signal peptidase I [Planctomycetes bacterium RBG_19FT_COMBO_48_8]|nr:MAG: signal peptidase I [Planctomycetes bacterium RBG_19FT_COMBO_48_8]